MSVSIDPNNPTANAQLTFDDEFDTLSLSNGTSGTWDTNYWYNVTGDSNAINSLPSNGEQEWYIDANDSRTSSVKPWTVSNGVLTIKASKTPSSIASAVDNYSYVSGELNTYSSFSQTYGLYEMRAKLPSGQGFWPAFWLLPESGAWPPELDIMENLGQDTSDVYTTVHSSTLTNGYSSQEDSVTDTTAWHIYAVDWEADYITWYIDGKEVYKVATPSDMNSAMYMELNLAVGGYWPGDADSSTNLDNTMQVDWVRVYQSDEALGLTSSDSSSSSTATTPSEGAVASTATTASHAYLANGVSDMLIQNTDGTLAVGEVSSGEVSYATVGGVGSEWSFYGSGAFSGDSHDQFLMENSNGTVAIGELQDGKAVYTTVSALGSEWTIETTGNFLSDGKDQFLIENTNGTVDLGEVSNGQATYTKVAALGSEWKFEGSGDFLGNGHDQFLIENTNGTVAVGDIQNGQATFTTVAALGSEWKFESTGDFLGDGKSQFLIENTNGTVSLGEVGSDGKVSYTTIGALGTEWKFVGSGDYLGEGHDQYALENSGGQVVIADVQDGTAHYTTVSALGSEWKFHS